MIRVVFDTNIILSAIVFGGKPEEAFSAARRGKCRLIVSPPILAEVSPILDSKFEWSRDDIADVIRTVGRVSELVKPNKKLRVVEDDADNRILECAAEGKADFVVSGDRHLLTLKKFLGIPILRAAEFLSRLDIGA